MIRIILNVLVRKPMQYQYLNSELFACSLLFLKLEAFPCNIACLYAHMWMCRPHPSLQAPAWYMIELRKRLHVMVTFSLCSNVDTTGLLKHVWQNGYLASHLLLHERLGGPTRALECISTTTMFVHAALLFWPIPSIQVVVAHLLCHPG